MRTTLALISGSLALSTLAACGDKTGTDSGLGDLPYCESFEDADTHTFEADSSLTGESGKIVGRIVTDESEDLHDPNFVSFVEYTLSNLDVGGSQQQGESDQDGGFQKIVGQGSWLLKLSTTKVGRQCTNEYEFQVKAGEETHICLDVGCED